MVRNRGEGGGRLEGRKSGDGFWCLEIFRKKGIGFHTPSFLCLQRVSC